MWPMVMKLQLTKGHHTLANPSLRKPLHTLIKVITKNRKHQVLLNRQANTAPLLHHQVLPGNHAKEVQGNTFFSHPRLLKGHEITGVVV